MKTQSAVALSLLVICGPSHVVAAADDACPKTTASDPLFGAAFPGWYGTEALAVEAPASGIWPTTNPGSLIAVKLAWRSAGFRPGTESNLKVAIENLEGGPVTAAAYGPSNEYPIGDPRGLSDADIKEIVRRAEASVDEWRMLTGMHFPDPGCWRITGEYLGQTVTFVVETVSTREPSDDNGSD